MRDRQLGTTQRVSVATDGTQANGASTNRWISDDGRYVAFESAATNLVPGDTNNASDIFVHDRTTGQTRRITVTSDGAQATGVSSLPQISGDGWYVTFQTTALNLTLGDALTVVLHDLVTGQTRPVSRRLDGSTPTNLSETLAISHDGRYMAFGSSATNLLPDDPLQRGGIFVADMAPVGCYWRVALGAGEILEGIDFGNQRVGTDVVGRHVFYNGSSFDGHDTAADIRDDDAVAGLAAPDVFYFGNAIGDAGNSATNAYVDGSDVAAARDNYRDMTSPAAIDFRFDYDRDSYVDVADMAIARDNGTSFMTALKLITVPPTPPSAAPGGVSALVLSAAEPAEAGVTGEGEEVPVIRTAQPGVFAEPLGQTLRPGTSQAGELQPRWPRQVAADLTREDRLPHPHATRLQTVRSSQSIPSANTSLPSVVDLVVTDLDPLATILDELSNELDTNLANLHTPVELASAERWS